MVHSIKSKLMGLAGAKLFYGGFPSCCPIKTYCHHESIMKIYLLYLLTYWLCTWNARCPPVWTAYPGLRNLQAISWCSRRFHSQVESLSCNNYHTTTSIIGSRALSFKRPLLSVDVDACLCVCMCVCPSF